MATAWSKKSVGQLLRDYAHVLAQLRDRGVIRTNNPPAGDYAEWLCAKALNGRLADNLAEKSYDLVLPSGEKIQVKARVVSTPRTAGQIKTSPFRSWDFDQAALVLFRDTDYRVEAAALVPRDLVRERATRVAHVNGDVLRMTPELMTHTASIDITKELRSAAATA